MKTPAAARRYAPAAVVFTITITFADTASLIRTHLPLAEIALAAPLLPSHRVPLEQQDVLPDDSSA